MRLAFPLESQPLYILLYGINIFDILLRGIRVIKTQVAFSLVLGCQPEVQAYRSRMPDMQVSIRFRREPRMYPTAVLSLGQLLFNNLFDEV